MYGLTALSAPDAPVSPEALRKRLRLNDPVEDDELAEFLAAATDLFENDAGRPVLATSYRQDLSRWPGSYSVIGTCVPDPALWAGGPFPPGGPIVLARGGVTAVTAVRQYNADGSATDLDPTTWRADLSTPPARVTLSRVPPPVATATGIPVSPVGCVQFTAGWATPADVPALVKTAIMLLAGHWYANREAWREGTLAELPDGWCRVVSRYKLGVSGTWGQ